MKRFRLPSVVQAGVAMREVFRRFPWAVFMAAAGTGAAVTLVEVERTGWDATTWTVVRVLLAALVGLPLAIAAEFFAAARNFSERRRMAVGLSSPVASALYFASLPGAWEHVPEAVYIRTGVLVLGLHLVVAYLPFAGRALEGEFWSYNWRLFLRFWLGGLYSAVLYVGLVAAVASASQLFDLKIKGERYAELWLVVVGLFNTCFFLHGAPRKLVGDPEGQAYPRGLRMFAQFALAPLVVVYLAILYPYAAKIVWVHEWPKGCVALPILCLATAGILAALFLHPIREEAEERWAAWYWRWFFRALFPLTVLLYLALRVRTSEYGVTESRYFGFVLAGWLAWVSAYYWWSANRSIRWLPASLAAVCLGCTWGPWGAFRVSERSQLARFERQLAARGLLVEGVLTPKAQNLTRKDFDELLSELRYLRSRHDSARLDALLQPFSARQDRAKASARSSAEAAAWGESQEVLTWLGVKNAGGRVHPFTLLIDAIPGAVSGYSREGVVLDLNRWTKPAKEPDPAWPQFGLTAEGQVVARTAAGLARVAAVNTLLDEFEKKSDEAPAKWRASWEHLSASATLDGHDYLIVVLRANGSRVAEGRLQVDALSLLVLAR